MANQQDRRHADNGQGEVKDAENDGRLKQNRESGNSKGSSKVLTTSNKAIKVG